MRRRDRRWWWGVFVGVVTLVLAALGVGRWRERRATRRVVDCLLRTEVETPARRRSDETFDDVPDPVRRYFDAVLPTAGTPAASVRVEQAGTLRTGGAASPWRRFTATHRATVGRPGFVWDARVGVLPFVSVGIRDAFVDCAGSARLSLWSALPISRAASTPELDEAELQRWLAEAVWYPTALLPGNGVVWESVDDHSARATATCGETTASVTFRFDGDDVVEQVHAAHRYRAVDGGFEPTPWTGVWDDYEERAGLRVPTRGTVVWHLPDGAVETWRGRVTDFERTPRGER